MSEVGGEKALGLRLQQARQAAGLTQQELCQRSGLSYSTLAKIERGAIKSPSIFTIQQIAGVLNTTIDTLLGDVRQEVPAAIDDTSRKVSKSGISFVYFDVHGCIVQFFHRAFVAIARDTGVLPDIVETTYWHYNDAVCRGDMTVTEFNEALGVKFGVKGFDWLPYYFEAVDGIKESHELLRWAHQHYRIGLLTNIMPGILDQLIARGLVPVLANDVIIDYSEVRAIKPEQKIYEIAAGRAGCSGAEVLFVDDSRANLMAADRLDWRVMWFDDYRPKESADRIRGTLAF